MRNGTPKIGVVMVVQNDEETIERTFKSFYDYVELIVVSTDQNQGWTGELITIDRSIELIKALDVEKKVNFILGNFCVYSEPMKNETFQRQVSVDTLCNLRSDLDWVCQIDADEEFLDFSQVLEFLSKVPSTCLGVRWSMAEVFNSLDDGRLLVVMDESGLPKLHSFHFATRPFTKYVYARTPSIQPLKINRQTLRFNELLYRFNNILGLIKDFDGRENPRGICLHHTFSKSEKRIWEKLNTWGHSKEFDIKSYYELWKRSKTDWREIRNFHFQNPSHWHSLSPLTIDEIQALQPD